MKKSIIVVDFKSTIKLMRMQNDHILVEFELLCTRWPFRSFTTSKIKMNSTERDKKRNQQIHKTHKEQNITTTTTTAHVHYSARANCTLDTELIEELHVKSRERERESFGSTARSKIHRQNISK